MPMHTTGRSWQCAYDTDYNLHPPMSSLRNIMSPSCRLVWTPSVCSPLSIQLASPVLQPLNDPPHLPASRRPDSTPSTWVRKRSAVEGYRS